MLGEGNKLRRMRNENNLLMRKTVDNLIASSTTTTTIPTTTTTNVSMMIALAILSLRFHPSRERLIQTHTLSGNRRWMLYSSFKGSVRRGKSG